MTALGINVTDRDPDLFYWPKPSTHGMPTEYWKLASEIDTLQARRLSSLVNSFIDGRI
jgi:hypothetical protein